MESDSGGAEFKVWNLKSLKSGVTQTDEQMLELGPCWAYVQARFRHSRGV